MLYVSEMPPEPKKGELNKYFNLYVERPFYIISFLGNNRYLDLLGRNVVIKTPNGFKTQQWWFDQKSKTIKNMKHKNWSFDI